MRYRIEGTGYSDAMDGFRVTLIFDSMVTKDRVGQLAFECIPGLDFIETIEEVDGDPTPWCSGCGAMKKAACKCGPIAENE